MEIKTKDLALIAMYAALYAALVIVLGGISYGPIQVRIADSMVAAVPLLGLPGVLGHTLGVFVGNIILTTWSNRPTKHYTFICHVFCSLLSLQTDKK